MPTKKFNKIAGIIITSLSCNQLYEEGVIGMGASNDKLLFALGLKRQRLRSGSTIRDVSNRLKSKSPNAYARYERAQARPSLEKYAELLHAANPSRRPLLVS
jgi:hypothetical protein